MAPTCQNEKLSQAAGTVNLKALSRNDTVSSGTF